MDAAAVIMQLIQNVADLLRGAGVPRATIGLFLLRLFAWEKAGRKGKVPSGYFLNEFDPYQDAKQFLRQAFNALENDEGLNQGGDGKPLPPGARPFEQDPEVLRFLSEPKLRDVLLALSRALQPAVTRTLDYAGVIEACLLLSASQEPYDTIPAEVADLMVNIAGVKPADSVYIPFPGVYWLAERCNQITREVYLETSTLSPLPALMNILLDGSLKVRFEDPIRNPAWLSVDGRIALRKFDVALANPPFSARYDRQSYPDGVFLFDMFERFPERTYYGDVLHVRHVLAQTRRRAVVVVSNAVLARTAAGERQFKADLLLHGRLEAVISLPPSLLTTTSVPISLMVLAGEDSPSVDSVLLIDASSQHFLERKGRTAFGVTRRTLKNSDQILQAFKGRIGGPISYRATLSECEANDYNLEPKRYVASTSEQLRVEAWLSGRPTRALGEIADVLRTQHIREETVGSDTIEVPEVAVADIDMDGYVRAPKKRLYLSKVALDKLRSQVLRPGDILFVTKGTVGKVGFVPEDLQETWLANQSFQILRLVSSVEGKQFIDPVVLFRYLASPVVRALVEARTTGGTSGIKGLQTRDVKELPVPVFSDEEQADIAEENRQIVSLYEQIAQLHADAERLAAARWGL